MTRHRRRRLLLASGGLLLVLALVGGGATIKLFVAPSTDRPMKSDAVLVLAGDYGSRLARALELMHGGVASVLVLDGNPDSERADRICREPVPFEVICLRPQNDSTRSEARAFGRLADERGWRTAVLVTSRFHVTRARLLVGRCFTGAMRVVGTDAGFSGRKLLSAIAREWGGFAHAKVAAREC